MATGFDLLPDVSFAEKSAGVVEAQIINKYEELAGRTLADGDPIRLFLATIAYVLTQQRALINFAGKNNLLKYATGAYLENLGAMIGVFRKEASKATTTLRFSVSSPLSFAVNIPAGTRATHNSQVFFATKEAAEISIGQSYVDIEAECLKAGLAGNGIATGFIVQMVDLIPYVAGVTNTTVTTGGADAETDEALRLRIREAPERFSVAGPVGAYRYHAISAHPLMVDVDIYSPEPGEVQIIPLLANGEIPSQDILDTVFDACSADDVRPLTDIVSVVAPTVVSYDINLEYWIETGNAALVSVIQANVSKAVTEYVAWQKGALGRDLNPSELIKRVMSTGAKRVNVISPSFTEVARSSVAVVGSTTTTYKGLENG